MPSGGGLLEKNQVGKREQLYDLLANVDDRGTPVTSMIKKVSELGNTQFSWLADKFDDPSTDATVDGTDVVNFESAAESRRRLYNSIHYFRKSGKVSTLAQKVSNVAGVPSEIGLARAKKLRELKRNMECAFCGDQDVQLDDGTVGYKTRGLGLWIVTTATSLPLYDIPSIYRVPAAQVNTTATANLVEDTDIQNLLQALFDATGMQGDYKLIAGSTLRRRFTDMTRTVANAANTATKIRTYTAAQAEKTVVMSTKIYEGDFGTIEIVPTNWNGYNNSTKVADKGRGYLLNFDDDRIAMVAGQLPQITPLPDMGGGPRFTIEAWAGLRFSNPLDSAKFAP